MSTTPKRNGNSTGNSRSAAKKRSDMADPILQALAEARRQLNAEAKFDIHTLAHKANCFDLIIEMKKMGIPPDMARRG